jgi:hypothetical protein
MRFNWFNQLGDWNPQLLREIKGRFKPRNLIIAGAISLLGQFLLLRVFQTGLPIAKSELLAPIPNKYCTDTANEYALPECLIDSLGNIEINWQLWWLDVFLWLSLFGVFCLLVGGTYLLISDLAHEERKDTLNFIRLSPQSPQSILFGKLLGVPILLYIEAGLAVPLHLWAGLSAQIPLSLILSFYGLLFASCLFFNSAALLFGLVSSWLGGFQALLGSGTVFVLLSIASFKPIFHTPGDWLNLFSPFLILKQLIAATNLEYSSNLPIVADLEWFYLPMGANILTSVGLALINFGLWTYWSCGALQRRFSNPGKSIFSKGQSYLLVASLEVMIIGFAATSPKFPFSTELSFNFKELLVFNLLLFIGLIVALTPQRQALQDWARYRHEGVNRKWFWNKSVLQDLIWGEKSPAIVAIALNLAIAATMLVLQIVFVLQDVDKLPALISLVIGVNLILIYTAIAQLLMFIRTQKFALWVTGTVGTAISLPPAILTLLTLEPEKAPGLWLFTPFAWNAIEQASASTIFLALLGQWSIFTLCSLRMNHQLQQAGESASKALFAERKSLPSRVR